ncbi:MAG TPA: PDZ domain-containing protein [Vicinamibacterales bacterium]|nr:PDZ domain-containing protein [Vicinamibacterales bacterium]
MTLVRIGFTSFVAAVVLWSCPVSAGQDATPNQSAEVEMALSKVSPSLVRIHVVTVDHRDGRELKREASGSGTIITAEGHVVTNHHVAGRTRSIVCTLPTREEVPAELVGTDPLSDIAILKLKPSKPRTFPVARFGDSSALRVGERVLALGSPLALSQSVTMGIVSNTEMIMPGMFWPFNRMTLDGEDVGSIVRWIGHDAAIFGGNSGGPLVNMKGEIVGVNEISFGLAGAIPADLAQEVANALMKNGRVSRGWIGLEVQPLLKSSTVSRGALVGGTIDGSPAEKAGFASGDVLIRLAGSDVSVRFGEEIPLFNRRVMRLPVGRPVRAVVLRKGVEKTLTVTPADRESAEARIEELVRLGITASNVTSWAAKELRRPDRVGVRVRGVRPGAPADEAKPGLRDNDVIVAVNETPVKDVASLTESVERLVRGRTEPLPVLIAFDRGPERLLTVLEVGRPGVQDPGMEARKAWVAVSVQAVTPEIADKIGIPGKSGVRVTRVIGGAAATAGLRVGDVITAIDGNPVQASQPSESEVFHTMIRQYRIGSSVALSTLRGKEARAVTLQLEGSPRLAREMKKYEDPTFEFRVRDMTDTDRRERDVPGSQKGVLVEAVREGGWAALAQLGDGDMILAIDGEPVADVAAVQSKMEKVASARAAAVVLHVRRGVRTFYVEMLTGSKEPA